MKIQKNPFSFGPVVKEGDYCPRDKEERVIEELLVSGEKVAIVGERRMGKTSLALHILEVKLSRPYVHVDFMGVRDEREAASRILNAISTSRHEFFKFETILKTLGHLKPSVTIGNDGNPSLSFNVKQNEIDESIDSAFKLLKDFCKKEVIVFFDEFQDLLKIEDSNRLFGILRGKIQNLNRIPFLFAGSYRSQMDRIFKDPENPFYNGATVIEVTTIDKKIFYNFTLKKMKGKDIKLSEDTFSKIYDMVYGVLGDVQRFFRTAYLLLEKKSELDDVTCKNILHEIFKYEQTTFQEIMTGSILTTLQRDILRELSVENTNPYSKGFMTKLETTSASGVTRGLNALESKNFIYRYRDEYRFYNPFFKEWIKSQHHIHLNSLF
ncbi:MAG: ATP-binding protein [Oligoflexia bacterium]|nr:ATP-binding protein [Oligoflexia bacterium]